MNTIKLPDGYNGNMVECYTQPIKEDANVAQLRVVGSDYLTRWVAKKDLSAAIDGNAPDFPYICPEHPNAQIVHEWDKTHFVMNGYPAGTGLNSNHHYYCKDCHRELAKP